MNFGRQYARLDAVVAHLREEEVRRPDPGRRRGARAAAVDLPVPQREDQEVGQPDQHAGGDQLGPLWTLWCSSKWLSAASE